MKIVVFDDDQSDRKKLCQIIDEWRKGNHYSDAVVMQFSRISDLGFSLDELVFSDIFFLDIMTPESDSAGFVLAERIDLKNPNAVIIFTTNSREYMENAFEISAFRYLLKPLEKDRVVSILERVYHSPALRSRTKAVFPGIFQSEVIDMDQIIYIQAQMKDHRAEIHQVNGRKIIISLVDFSFSSLPEKYLTDDFVQCHRSTIINLNYVTSFDHHSVWLLEKYEIAVGRTYRSDLVNLIINHSKRQVL